MLKNVPDAEVSGCRRLTATAARGELEITDVTNAYIRGRTLSFSYLDGWWTDAAGRQQWAC